MSLFRPLNALSALRRAASLTCGANCVVARVNVSFNVASVAACMSAASSCRYVRFLSAGRSSSLLPVREYALSVSLVPYTPLVQQVMATHWLCGARVSAARPTTAWLISARDKHLLLIRREKMKKHKRRKLKRKMAFIWDKWQRKKVAMKERQFQNEQLTLMADADKFDARKYVDDLLVKTNTAPLSTVWKGTRRPYFLRLPKAPLYKKLE